MALGWMDGRFARIESTTLMILGLVEIIFSLTLLIPAAFALYYGEDPLPFLIPVPFLLAFGLVQYSVSVQSRGFRTVNGLLLVALVWLIIFAICTLPYMIYGLDPMDAVFESVSGVTTTGMSVLGDLTQYPMSLLIWRSMTQWIGGITVVLIFLYFLPMVGYGRGLFANELAGYGSSEFTQRTSKAAKSFILVYLFLSLINFLLLVLAGVQLIEALCLTFTTISTGGLTIINSNMIGYSDIVQWITVLFMFLGGTNFYLHFRAIYLRERHVYRRNSEFRMMVVWFIAISTVIFLFKISAQVKAGNGLDVGNLYDSFKNVLFTTVSLGTTTGYYTEDFTTWPSQCMLILMTVALIGTSSSSTSGGIKFSRLRIIFEFVKNGFRGIMHANAVYSVKMDGKSVDDSVVRSALVVFVMYMATLMIGAVIVMFYGYDMVDSFGLSISVISNGGMGFGNFGPTGNFTDLESSLKAILTILMWIGRLEIVTALILFTPGFWKDVWLNSRARRNGKRSRS